MALSQLMANSRLTRLYVPTLGGGHGGLKPDVSLLSLLLAFAELRGRLGHVHLREVNIIVFRSSPESSPSVSESVARRALTFAANSFSG